MKLIASLLLWMSLGLGAIAGTTAYRPTLDAIASAGAPLTLAAPAGLAPRAEDATGDPEPLVRPAAPGAAPVQLDAALVARLREAGVERVRVKEFALSRWKEAWLFGLACLGLGAAATLIRLDARRQHARAESATDASGQVRLSPDEALASAHRTLEELRNAIGGRPDDAGLKRIVDCLNELQAAQFNAFVDARSRLLGSLGMGRYARLMGSFATAERQLNRAWSAAADRVPEEAILSLDAGIASLAETRAELSSTKDARNRA
jgi:hypothetical protein